MNQKNIMGYAASSFAAVIGNFGLDSARFRASAADEILVTQSAIVSGMSSDTGNQKLDDILLQLNTPRRQVSELPSTANTDNLFAQVKCSQMISEYQTARMAYIRALEQKIGRPDLPSGCIEFMCAQYEVISVLKLAEQSCKDVKAKEVIGRSIADTEAITFGSEAGNALMLQSRGTNIQIELLGMPQGNFTTPEEEMRKHTNELINKGLEKVEPAAKWVKDLVLQEAVERALIIALKLVGIAAETQVSVFIGILETTPTGCQGLNEEWDKNIEKCVSQKVNEYYPVHHDGTGSAKEGREFSGALDAHVREGMSKDSKGEGTGGGDEPTILPGTPVTHEASPQERPEKGGSGNSGGDNGGGEDGPGLTMH